MEIENKNESEFFRNWFESNTVDLWRHLRSLNSLLPVIENYPKSKWLCVGDGSYGMSALFINKNGANAVPLDINDRMLKIAKEEEIISEYVCGNAESLPFGNNSFDFVHCKESFHHFEKPYIALYEMLRVSKVGIVLSEPSDWIPTPITRRFLQKIKHFIYNLVKKNIPNPDEGNYEPEGNYVFCVSEREIVKISTALGLHSIAVKYYNDIYFHGVENEKLDENGPLFKKIKKGLYFNKVLTFLGISKPNRIIIFVFKEKPIFNAIEQIQKLGFIYKVLAENPYRDSSIQNKN